jgi:hypothetical protein
MPTSVQSPGRGIEAKPDAKTLYVAQDHSPAQFCAAPGASQQIVRLVREVGDVPEDHFAKLQRKWNASLLAPLARHGD